MASIKKSEIEKLTPAERKSKVLEMEKAILEMRGEGQLDKVRPLRQAIARLKTPPQAKKVKKP